MALDMERGGEGRKEDRGRFIWGDEKTSGSVISDEKSQEFELPSFTSVEELLQSMDEEEIKRLEEFFRKYK